MSCQFRCEICKILFSTGLLCGLPSVYARGRHEFKIYCEAGLKVPEAHLFKCRFFGLAESIVYLSKKGCQKRRKKHLPSLSWILCVGGTAAGEVTGSKSGLSSVKKKMKAFWSLS